ncbi:hypothetical protein [Arthrobacter sp. zg-Y769]|uniref:hypothetical protein n=1 Tax=Arthrobacter sp. zg-Y769 TaxID=2894191 RepID=UPI001E635617|nr:hypothetical protein [Arthrobacter sp. zg-Y769]MCC9203762.1 hypothetical protein [Arthrobacter sp. zg-Y769]
MSRLPLNTFGNIQQAELVPARQALPVTRTHARPQGSHPFRGLESGMVDRLFDLPAVFPAPVAGNPGIRTAVAASAAELLGSGEPRTLNGPAGAVG